MSRAGKDTENILFCKDLEVLWGNIIITKKKKRTDILLHKYYKKKQAAEESPAHTHTGSTN